ncbi:MAG: hypothetical protein P1U34_10970 [Coxiellaceae bacterium]|nr:hypothetical protein [Coxiellaceae bacterium]
MWNIGDIVDQLSGLVSDINPTFAVGLWAAFIVSMLYVLDKKYDLSKILTEERELVDMDDGYVGFQWSCGHRLVSPWKQEAKLLSHRRRRYPGQYEHALFRLLHEEQALLGIAEEDAHETIGEATSP